MATKMLLEEAARYGKLEVLENLVKENPAVVADFRLKSLGAASLLHEATKCRQLSFVRELMKIDPDVAAEMDKDGFRPLDIAVIMGNLEIVKELLMFNLDLCMLKGKDGRTALHYAAIKGRIDAIDILLNSCPDSIGDLTVHAETALHLAVKNHQFDAFTALLEWVERLRKESMVNMADDDGNTILHLAVLTKQYACVDLVLAKNRGRIDVNARNGNGWTILDVVDVQDSYDMKINQKLENEGAVRSPGSHSIDAAKWVKQARYYKPESTENLEDWFSYFKFKMERDSPSDTRNALLVIAVLIATVCFQTCVQPPAGILGNSSSLSVSPPPPAPSPAPSPEIKTKAGPGSVAGILGNSSSLSVSPPPPAPSPESPPPSPESPESGTTVTSPGSVAGIGVVASSLGLRVSTFVMFLFANSLGFTSATCIIIYLTSGFPFKREFHIALYSMMFTYGVAVHSLIKDHEHKHNKTWAYVLVTLAFTLPFALRWLPRWGRKAWTRCWRN